jgi:hypothetical protein
MSGETSQTESKEALPVVECGYDKWHKSMLKQIGKIAGVEVYNTDGAYIPHPHKITEPVPGAIYWIALDTAADLIKGSTRRWRSPRKYRVSEFSVWKSLQRRHTYEVHMKDCGSHYMVVSAQEIPAPAIVVGERPWED